MNTHINQWLAAYHDGELRGRRLAQVEAHLAECPDCQGELEQLQALSALLAEAPEAPSLTTTDRFAAQVGLRLSRRPAQQTAPVPRPGRVGAALPIIVLAGFGLLWIVQWLASGLSIARMFGFGEAAVAALTSAPVRPAGLAGQYSIELIKLSVPFSPQILVGIVLPAILATAYLLWLVIWSLNQRDVEGLHG